MSDDNVLTPEAPVKQGAFRRARGGVTAKNVEDNVGSVRVVISLGVGNITRTFTVRESRVSDVASHIERFLFGSGSAAA